MQQLLPALPWLLPFAALFRLARKEPDLARVPPATSGPLVSIIIPARDEAEAIETVVRSALAAGYPALEVLVVDDRSADATAAIVRRLAEDPAAGAGRLRLVSGVELPEGWYGKPWACHQGAQAARGEILVFTDADTRHGPELVSRAVAALALVPAGLVTVAPFQRCESFWERVIMPQVWLLLGLRFHPATVNRGRHERDVIANGQFIMLRRETYDRLGGHAAVRAEVAEDLALAQRAWRMGERIHFAFAERHMETRMYTGLPQVIEGWSKNIYLGSRRAYPDEPVRRALVPVGLALAMLYWLVPAAGLALAGLGLVSAGALPWLATATALAVLFWALISGGMRIPPWYGLLHPLGAGMALYIILRSTIRGRTRVVWKGRTYGSSINRASS